MGPLRLILLLWLLACACVSPAAAEKRLALVIGNSTYRHAPALRNPANDAHDLAAALTRLGFEVISGVDLDYAGMRSKVREFSDKLSGTDVALFFYAGHGLQVAGKNYLTPVDARINSQADLDFGTIDLDLVVRAMEAEKRTNIVFLDACRDNPLARPLVQRLGARSTAVGRGLAPIRADVGTLIAYATQPGNIALDGNGRNSPFTEALLRSIERPGLSLGEVMIAVRNEVLRITSGKQVPWDHSSLTGQFFFRPAPVVGAAAPLAAAAPPAAASPRRESSGDVEIAFWNSIKDAKNPRLYEAYLKRYPAGAFADIARIRLEEFKVAVAKPMVPKVGEKKVLDDPASLRELRERLYELNFDPAEGAEGMRAAIREFETQNKLAATGEPTEALLRRLREIGGLKPWGAIVYGEDAGKWGMSWGHASRRSAVDGARAHCRPERCAAEISFFGTGCGAFALSPDNWSMVARDNIERARRAALDECARRGKSCRVVGAVCADGAGHTAN